MLPGVLTCDVPMTTLVIHENKNSKSRSLFFQPSGEAGREHLDGDFNLHKGNPTGKVILW